MPGSNAPPPTTQVTAQAGEFTQITTAAGLFIEVHPDGESVGIFRSRDAFDAGDNPLVGVLLDNGYTVSLLYPIAHGGGQAIEHRR